MRVLAAFEEVGLRVVVAAVIEQRGHELVEKEGGVRASG